MTVFAKYAFMACYMNIDIDDSGGLLGMFEDTWYDDGEFPDVGNWSVYI